MVLEKKVLCDKSFQEPVNITTALMNPVRMLPQGNTDPSMTAEFS